MDWHEAIKKWGQQQRLLNQAKTEEENNNLEAAFELYQHAAALGNGDAMVAIGNLYAVKNFRMKETYDFLEHVLKGSTLMPYNLTKKQEPDLKTALEWYIKAAEQDHPDGCFAAGAMLCEGKGCESDVERGLMYLKKADEKGMPSARQVICIYDPTESLYLSDDEYEKLLERFVQAVDSCTLEQFELYSRLKGGTESQQTRLGYTLITRRNLEDPKYQSFKYLFSPEGIPLLPCCARRGAWKSFVRVDLNAFRSDDIYIAFATDISNSFVESSRLTPVGSAVYRSPAFGWLGEEKKSLVLKVDRTCVSQQIQEIAEEFGLLPKEYAEENAAFIVENGEKEYSVEFAVIENGKVHVLYRYTIDGPDEIHSSFEPELISLTIDKYDADTINKETNGVSEECEQQENASKSINCANHCRKNMRLKLINAICDPERSSEFKKMLNGSFDVEEVSNSKFNQIMMTHKFFPPWDNQFLASLETDLLVFAYDSSPLSGKFMNMFWKHKDLVKKAIFVIYASNDYFVQNIGLIEQKAAELQKFYPKEDINNRLYLININNLMDIFAFKDKITNLRTENSFTPSLEIQFDENLIPFGKGVIDIRKEVALPNIDFWTDEKFVQLTKSCATGDTDAMMELGRYYESWDNCEFCQFASNYWYYTAYLYGNEDAGLWVDKWFLEHPNKKLPMPILPSKLYKTYKKMVHDNEHCYRGAMLKALGFGFFSEKRTYEMYHFFEPNLVQFCSWCNTEDPDEDGYGMSEEYDWWFLDELFNELPGVKMIHSYSFHDRQYACTETFEEQYESAKRAIENKKLQPKERNNKL